MSPDDAGTRARPEAARLPTFLIIGAMKGGTTSFAMWLSEHPEIFMPRRKELHYFDVNHRKGLDWYLRWFEGSEGYRAIGEATPGYMFREEAFNRLADLLPEARLLAVLRNPIDRAYSHYWHRRTNEKERRDFGEIVAMEQAAPELAEQWAGYLARGQYIDQLRRVTERFPRQRLFVTLLDDLRDAPTETYRQACDFLGVSDVVPPIVGIPYQPSVRLRRRYDRALDRARIDRWLPRPLARRLRARGRSANEYPPMDPAVRARLVEHFRPYNDALAAWLGRDLTPWNR